MASMSPAQYARHRKISPAAVSQAITSGRISVHINPSNGQRYIDSEEADIQWTATKTRPSPQEIKQGKVLEEKSGRDKNSVPTITESKAIKEAYLARLAKLDYEEKTEKLVDIEKVKLEAFKLGRMVRDQILIVPDRIAPELATISDAFEIRRILTEQLTIALEELSRGAPRR